MDFKSTQYVGISFPNFSGFGVALLLQPPKSYDINGQEMFKKCSTDQRLIRKRNTTYKIHTLVNSWHRKPPKNQDLRIFFIYFFILFHILLDQKQGQSLQTVSSAIYETLQNAPQEKQMRFTKSLKNQNKNFMEKKTTNILVVSMSRMYHTTMQNNLPILFNKMLNKRDFLKFIINR